MHVDRACEASPSVTATITTSPRGQLAHQPAGREHLVVGMRGDDDEPAHAVHQSSSPVGSIVAASVPWCSWPRYTVRSAIGPPVTGVEAQRRRALDDDRGVEDHPGRLGDADAHERGPATGRRVVGGVAVDLAPGGGEEAARAGQRRGDPAGGGAGERIIASGGVVGEVAADPRRQPVPAGGDADAAVPEPGPADVARRAARSDRSPPPRRRGTRCASRWPASRSGASRRRTAGPRRRRRTGAPPRPDRWPSAAPGRGGRRPSTTAWCRRGASRAMSVERAAARGGPPTPRAGRRQQEAGRQLGHDRDRIEVALGEPSQRAVGGGDRRQDAQAVAGAPVARVRARRRALRRGCGARPAAVPDHRRGR